MSFSGTKKDSSALQSALQWPSNEMNVSKDRHSFLTRIQTVWLTICEMTFFLVSSEFRFFNWAKKITVFHKIDFWKLAKFNQSFFNRKCCLWFHPVVYFYKMKITDFGFSNWFHAVNIQFELVHWTISSRLVPSWTNQSQNWKRCEIPMSKFFSK